MRTAVIVNPRSAGGKTERRWPGVAALLERRLGPVEARFTQRPGHATLIARELLHQGFDRILAAGGDGTIHEVANGFVENDYPLRPEAALGIVPLGTGGDFRRTLEIPSSPGGAIEALAESRPRLIDLGKATFRARDGSTSTRYFVNLLSFGMGGEVASRAQTAPPALGGSTAFLYATLISFFVYQQKRVRLRLDGSEAAESFAIYNIAVGNGRFHGGGMRVCPTADPSDGVFEVTVIDYLRRWEALKDLRVLYSENVYRHPKVRHLRASRLQAESAEEVRIEIDGEPLGTLPLEVEVLPQRLNVLFPPAS